MGSMDGVDTAASNEETVVHDDTVASSEETVVHDEQVDVTMIEYC